LNEDDVPDSCGWLGGLDGERADGQDSRRGHGAGSVQIHDLRRSPVSDIRDPFHVLYFYLPRRVLDPLSQEMRTGPIDAMQLQPRTAGARDPIVEHLMLSVLPAMDKPGEMNDLFADTLRSHSRRTWLRSTQACAQYRRT
jgi:hypothetical protein